MKPLWARKLTTCRHCGDDVSRGHPRVDDMVRNGRQILRLHYHLPCFHATVDNWFSNNPRPQNLEPKGGRPKLELTAEQKQHRRRLLARLSSLHNYYLPSLKLRDIDSLTRQDLDRFHHFHQRRKELLRQLESCGGIPERYQDSRKRPEAEEAESTEGGKQPNDEVGAMTQQNPATELS